MAARFLSTSRQRLGTGKFLEEVDDFAFARQPPDRLLQLLGHERRRLIAGELFEFFVKLRIFESFAHRFLQDLHPLFRRSRRKDIGQAGGP
jgi:hypothetical protein